MRLITIFMGTGFLVLLLSLSPVASAADPGKSDPSASGTAPLPLAKQPARSLVEAGPPGPAPSISGYDVIWSDGYAYPRPDRVLAGSVLRLRGTDLRWVDLVVTLGDGPGTALQVAPDSDGHIRATMPSTVTTGALRARYTGGEAVVLNPALQVVPRPTVQGVQWVEGPWIGVPSRARVSFSNIPAALANAEITVSSPDCWTGGRTARLPSAGTSATLEFATRFEPSGIVANLPGTTRVENLVALSGRTCPLKIAVGKPFELGVIAIGFPATLPTVAAHTIQNTWDLMSYQSPSGKRFGASVSHVTVVPGGEVTSPVVPSPCTVMSIGPAGTFPMGIVNAGGDLSFQLRSGVLPIVCGYSTTERLAARPGWVIIQADWQFESSSALCGNQPNGPIPMVEHSPGSWGAPVAGFVADPGLILPKLRLRRSCAVNTSSPGHNGALSSVTLRSVTLVGPANQTWRQAFQ